MIISGMAIASYVALWAIVIVQTLVIFEVLRQIGILRRRMPADPGALLTDEGLPRGSLAPQLTALDLQTGQLFRAEEGRGRTTVVVFLSPTCGGCHALAPDLWEFAETHARDVDVVVICAGPRSECEQFGREHRLRVPLLLDEDRSLSHAYRVRRTPIATLIDGEQRVRITGVANNGEHLEGLLREEGTPMGNKRWIARKTTEKEVVAMNAN